MSALAVKALQWWTDNVEWWAYPYRIRVDRGSPDLYIVSGWQSGTNPYDTLEEAKTAAQADHEKRIRSAIKQRSNGTPSPQQ